MDQKQTYCVGSRHKPNTIKTIEYEERNHKTQKDVKVKKKTGDI